MVDASWLLFVVASLVLIATPAQHPTLSVLVLGVAFAALTFLVKAPVGLFSGALSAWLRSRPDTLTWVHRCSGAILVGLGFTLAVERR